MRLAPEDRPHVTPEVLEWVGNIEVLDTKEYPLLGAQEKRTWAPDPRLSNLKDTKNSDVVTYYNHIATLRHKKYPKLMFIVARETMDALMGRQKDPVKYPMWRMAHGAKQCERRTTFWVVKNKPTATTTHLTDWLVSIEDAFPDALWMYDALAMVILQKGVVEEVFYGRPSY